MSPYPECYLAWDDVEERFVTRYHPLEVEVHPLQDLHEDDVEPAPSIDQGLRKQGSLQYRLNDERVVIAMCGLRTSGWSLPGVMSD
jgi:hypothetical protein